MIFCIGLCAVFGFALNANAQEIPTPNGFVSDQAGVISASQEQILENTLAQYETETSNEIAILTLQSLEDGSIEDFAVRVFEEWRIGKEGQDNGALILLSVDDRETRIEVGYGLEGVLTDGATRLILERSVSPYFAVGNYDQGFSEGVNAVILEIGDEFSGDAIQNTGSEEFQLPSWVTIAIIAFIIFSLVTGKGRGFAWFLLSIITGGRGGGGGFGGFGGGGSGGGGSSSRH